MTEQLPDSLLCECDDIDFKDLELYGIATGDITTNNGWGDEYTFAAKATPDPNYECSALWSGYRSIYRLDSSGTLTLESFDYPFHEGREADVIGEQLVGNFWLILKPSFEEARTYVPFQNGVIVKDRSRWIHEHGG
jgi:hypothetical protein